MLYGVFNLVFFRNYYRAPGKVGKAFGWGCGALTLCMVVFEACAHTVPFVRDRLDTPDPAFLGEKLTLLAAGAALYVLLSALALRRAMHSFCRAGPVSQPRVLQCKTSKRQGRKALPQLVEKASLLRASALALRGVAGLF